MAVKLRLTRHGTKKRPFYWLVVANSTAPRDGSFIEKLGTYNPLLDRDNAERVKLNKERILYWLSVGAIPSEKSEKLFKITGIALPKKLQFEKDRKDAVRKVIAEKALAAKAAKKEAEAKKAAEEDKAKTIEETPPPSASDEQIPVAEQPAAKPEETETPPVSSETAEETPSTSASDEQIPVAEQPAAKSEETETPPVSSETAEETPATDQQK
jgi:small subunit ribosomal protein S16